MSKYQSAFILLLPSVLMHRFKKTFLFPLFLPYSHFMIEENIPGSYYPGERSRSSITVYPCTAYRKDENKALQRENNNGKGILLQLNAGIHPIQGSNFLVLYYSTGLSSPNMSFCLFHSIMYRWYLMLCLVL